MTTSITDSPETAAEVQAVVDLASTLGWTVVCYDDPGFPTSVFLLAATATRPRHLIWVAYRGRRTMSINGKQMGARTWLDADQAAWRERKIASGETAYIFEVPAQRRELVQLLTDLALP